MTGRPDGAIVSAMDDLDELSAEVLVVDDYVPHAEAVADVLGTVRFLLSPAAELINGQLILIDGGYTLA